MKYLRFSLLLILLTSAIAASDICGCNRFRYITAPTVTNVPDIAHRVLHFIEDNYHTPEDPFIKGLNLDLKRVYDTSTIGIDKFNKCFKVVLRGGVFDVDGQEVVADIVLSGQGTDTGPVNTVCKCSQKSGHPDFCDSFLRNRIFERVTALACNLGDNKPAYCCNSPLREIPTILLDAKPILKEQIHHSAGIKSESVVLEKNKGLPQIIVEKNEVLPDKKLEIGLKDIKVSPDLEQNIVVLKEAKDSEDLEQDVVVVKKTEDSSIAKPNIIKRTNIPLDGNPELEQQTTTATTVEVAEKIDVTTEVVTEVSA